jgi:hypothetical protein
MSNREQAMREFHAIFQTDIIEAMNAALNAGLDAEETIYLLLGHAFNLFQQKRNGNLALAFDQMARVAEAAIIRHQKAGRIASSD